MNVWLQVYAILPWIIIMWLFCCYIAFGGRFKIKYIRRQGIIFQLKIRHPIKQIKEAIRKP